MAQSTTTLIEAVNRVLLDCGERAVTSISSPAALKAKEYLRDAISFIQSVHDWEWMYNKKIATNWVNESATVDAAQIRRVLWHNGYNNIPVYYLDSVQFDTQQLLGFTTLLTTATYPRYYTISGYNTVRVNPYPIDSVSQSLLTFHVIENLTFPSNPTDLFPLPEKYMPMLYARAGYLMAQRHLEDSNSAQFYDKEFQEYVLRYRSQENKTPTHGFNMYRERYRRFYNGI